MQTTQRKAAKEAARKAKAQRKQQRRQEKRKGTATAAPSEPDKGNPAMSGRSSILEGVHD
jgi:hypothetical protein